MPAAYQVLEQAAPEIKILVEPLITNNQLHSTPDATANATLECLAALISADERKVHGQVLLHGEFYGLNGVCGIPLCLRANHWHMASAEPLTAPEIDRLRCAIAAIIRNVEGVFNRFSAMTGW